MRPCFFVIVSKLISSFSVSVEAISVSDSATAALPPVSQLLRLCVWAALQSNFHMLFPDSDDKMVRIANVISGPPVRCNLRAGPTLTAIFTTDCNPFMRNVHAESAS